MRIRQNYPLRSRTLIEGGRQTVPCLGKKTFGMESDAQMCRNQARISSFFADLNFYFPLFRQCQSCWFLLERTN